MVESLETHPRSYLTVRELAQYWCVSSRAVHRLIQSGALRAVHLGPRSVRVNTGDARECEEQMKLRTVPIGTVSSGRAKSAVQHTVATDIDRHRSDVSQKMNTRVIAGIERAAHALSAGLHTASRKR